jgi:hypothetical protein
LPNKIFYKKINKSHKLVKKLCLFFQVSPKTGKGNFDNLKIEFETDGRFDFSQIWKTKFEYIFKMSLETYVRPILLSAHVILLSKRLIDMSRNSMLGKTVQKFLLVLKMW